MIGSVSEGLLKNLEGTINIPEVEINDYQTKILRNEFKFSGLRGE